MTKESVATCDCLLWRLSSPMHLCFIHRNFLQLPGSKEHTVIIYSHEKEPWLQVNNERAGFKAGTAMWYQRSGFRVCVSLGPEMPPLLWKCQSPPFTLHFGTCSDYHNKVPQTRMKQQPLISHSWKLEDQDQDVSMSASCWEPCWDIARRHRQTRRQEERALISSSPYRSTKTIKQAVLSWPSVTWSCP